MHLYKLFTKSGLWFIHRSSFASFYTIHTSPGLYMFFKTTIWCDSVNVWICIPGHLLAIQCEGERREQESGCRERSSVVLPGFCYLVTPSPASLYPSVKWEWWFSFYQPHGLVWRLLLNHSDESAQGCRTGLLWLLCGWGCLLLLFINTSMRNLPGGGFLSFLQAALARAAQFTESTSAPAVSPCCLSWWKMTSYYFLPLGLGGPEEISSHIRLLLLL